MLAIKLRTLSTETFPRLLGALLCLLISGCSVIAPEATELVGKEAPNGAFEIGSQPTRLNDLRGNWVVLCFWETRCGFSSSAVASCGELADEYSNKPVKVIGVSLDEPDHEEKWREKVAELDAKNLLHAFSGNGPLDELFMRFKLNVVPSFVVIDPAGIVKEVTWRMGVVEDALSAAFPATK